LVLFFLISVQVLHTVALEIALKSLQGHRGFNGINALDVTTGVVTRVVDLVVHVKELDFNRVIAHF